MGSEPRYDCGAGNFESPVELIRHSHGARAKSRPAAMSMGNYDMCHQDTRQILPERTMSSKLPMFELPINRESCHSLLASNLNNGNVYHA